MPIPGHGLKRVAIGHPLFADHGSVTQVDGAHPPSILPRARTMVAGMQRPAMANRRSAVARFLCGLVSVWVAGMVHGADPANFERCVANDRSCNEALLTVGERRQVMGLQGLAHFRDCLAGLRCNLNLLTGDEQRRVQQATARLNYQACLRGDADCRRRALSARQRTEVELADSARNFEFCLGGLIACDESALTDEQRAVVRAAYLERNYLGCMNTVGTLVRCNPDDLSAAQRERVRRRNVETNLYVCVNALFGCDERLLTLAQRAQLKDGRAGAH
ncbi:MAG: hypothetical protein WDZ63_05440 [Burkholderiales bacterium]